MPTPPRTRLTQQNLGALRAGVAVPAYDRSTTEVGIVHFGPGAFHRGHQAWYLDTLLARDPRWAICAAEIRPPGLAQALIPQDLLYVVAELDERIRFRVIGSMKEYLLASQDADRIYARLTQPQVKLVTLTITEKGYCLDGNGELDLQHPAIAYDLTHPTAPKSAIGWVTEGLARRKAKGLAPFVAISCDNVVGNGHKFRNAVLGLAQARGDKELAAWIAGEVRFPCTMVDSITPAADEALKQKVAESVGLYDDAPVQRESFLQWAIEDVLGSDAPDLASVGASLTNDVEAYEQAKIRLLNGAHSTLAYAGLLAGYTSVGEAMNDTRLAGFVARMMREDITPSLRGTRGLDFENYIGAILQRFRNPALTHRLYQIASDGSQKLPYRILGTITDALSAGRPIRRLAVPVAAWMAFVVREAKEGRALNDPLAKMLADVGGSCVGKASADLPRFLALREVFPANLAKEPKFNSAVGAAYDNLDAFLD
ncbi:MAG: mannitol dehydrogenase family protein [Alphaproteobacteria bacterium]|nr:mannitol dehydrogenase family protein [Alphaproteobacteria bacterium]MDE2110168.1 mannitol dehydrogenase family protein [Alphaproteobacteria bacterium]MDE2492502.1 mannitol dehydrogenase family protein [Alphaproteobacteria bacterium]